MLNCYLILAAGTHHISFKSKLFLFRHEESFPPIILGWEKGILGTHWVKRIQLMCCYDTILVLMVNCTLLARNWTPMAIKLPPHCLRKVHREVQILPAVTTKTAPTWVTKSNSSIFLKECCHKSSQNLFFLCI